MGRITDVDAQLFRLPLPEVLSDAKHGEHTHFELITATIRLDDGSVGTGYSYTGGRGGHSIHAMIVHDLAPYLIGRLAEDVERLHDELRLHIHYVGRGGVSAFAIAALDVALWDIRGKRENRSLAQMAGGASDRCRAYAGGIDLNFSLDRLVANADAYLAQGYTALKIKVGRPRLEEDVERVFTIRERIGHEASFMVDANYGMSLETALQAVHHFENANLTWFEEPIDPDDYAGYRALHQATGVPLAIGENCHSLHDFELLERTGAFQFFQPDVSTCGGITTWLRVAELAEKVGVSVCSHGMQELHVSLLAGRQDPGWLEVHAFPIDQYTMRPLRLDDQGLAIAPNTPGIGVQFDWEKLNASVESV